jgi:hypothetical protein
MLSIFAVGPDRNNRGSPASGKKRMCVINSGGKEKTGVVLGKRIAE